MIGMESLPSILTSVAVGMTVAVLLRGRLSGLFAGAQMGLRDMKMVLVVRSDLELGRNKAAIQCSHAAINCYKRATSDTPKVLKRWESQGQTKVVLKISGEAEILSLAKTAEAAGLVAVLVHDSTSPHLRPVATVLGIGPGPANLVDKVAGHLKLF